MKTSFAQSTQRATSSGRSPSSRAPSPRSVVPAPLDEEQLVPTPPRRESAELVPVSRRKSILVVTEDLGAVGTFESGLRRDSPSWDVELAIGVRAGLSELADTPYDVVVADADMTPMDGAALLEHVSQEYPSTGRVLVGRRPGGPSPATTFDLHIARLGDGSALREGCERVSAVYGAIRHWSSQSVVSAFCRDREPPSVYWELTRAMADAGVGVRECARIVEKKPDFVERILRFVNAAGFGHGLPQRITSISQAITYMGMELLAGLVLVAHAHESARGVGIEGLSFERMQRQSLLTARVARRLAASPSRAADAFTAALVHDVGKVVLAETIPERYRAALRTARATAKPLHEVEHERFGITHADVGACLLHQWRVPFDVVEAVAFHHTPSALASENREVLACVHIADALVDAGRSPYERAVEPYLDRAFLRRAALLGEMPRFRLLAAQELEAVTAR